MTATPDDVPKWKYRVYWYFAFTYFYNKHFVNSSVSGLKTALSKLEDRFYKKEWEGIELKNPIFILGPHRSGTTILQQILSLHSQIATPRTYSDIFDMFPIFSKKYFASSIIGRNSRKIDSIIVGFDSPQEAHGMMLRYLERERILYNVSTPEDIRKYMKKLLYLEGKSRFLWKVPYLTICVPEIIELFPDAKFIYLYRDPLTCIDSKLKLIKVWQELAQPPSYIYGRLVGKHKHLNFEGLGYFMEETIRAENLECRTPNVTALSNDHLDWMERALVDLKGVASKDVACFLNYMALIQNPEASLKSLFDFLGLNNENERIISRLKELGMPLKMPGTKINNIPESATPGIREMCRQRMNKALSEVEWQKWHIVGEIPKVE